MERVLGYSRENYRMCEQEIETTKHIPCDCTFSRDVWYSVLGARRKMQSLNISTHDWIKRLIESKMCQLDEDLVVKMANISWEI